MSSNMQCFTTYYKNCIYMIEPWFLDSFQAAYRYCKPFLKLSQDLFN